MTASTFKTCIAARLGKHKFNKDDRIRRETYTGGGIFLTL